MVPTASSLPAVPQPHFRSGAVARLAAMPVATLRIWEQRYQAVRPAAAASGHRLYSAADVERVILLRRLTQQGHAIGLLAALDIAQMRELARGSSGLEPPAEAAASPRRAAMRIVVVGPGLADRQQRLATRLPGVPAPRWLGFFDSLADAAEAGPGHGGAPADLLLWQAASLQAGALPALRAAQQAWGARAVAVTYHYSNASARAELVGAGAVLAREPADDAAWAQWLASLAPQAPADANRAAAAEGAHGLAQSLPAPGLAPETISAPRFADAGLLAFAQLPSAVACECPGHLAELILQVSRFESYSAGCAHRSAADAQLHAGLQRVAGAARMLFEAALEQVALAEGLPLPAGPDVLPAPAPGP